jgi:hypothetical protein
MTLKSLEDNESVVDHMTNHCEPTDHVLAIPLAQALVSAIPPTVSFVSALDEARAAGAGGVVERNTDLGTLFVCRPGVPTIAEAVAERAGLPPPIVIPTVRSNRLQARQEALFKTLQDRVFSQQ